MLRISNLGGTPVGASDVVFSTLYNSVAWSNNASFAGRTIVVITPYSITGFTQFRLSITNGPSDADAAPTSFYLGQLSGTYSFASSPSPITWGPTESATCAFTAVNEARTSNIVSYTPSGTGTLCISFYIPSTTTNSIYRNNVSGHASYTKSGSDDAITQAKTGYSTTGTNRVLSIHKIEAAP